MQRYELLNELDSQIDEKITKFRNARTGADVKIAILEYEELMYKREKEFTRLVMEEQKNMKHETTKTTKLNDEKENPLLDVKNERKLLSDAKKESHDAVVIAIVALLITVLRIALKELGVWQ